MIVDRPQNTITFSLCGLSLRTQNHAFFFFENILHSDALFGTVFVIWFFIFGIIGDQGLKL